MNSSDERTAKRRSIFTVSSILPSNSSKTVTHDLSHLVSQVNSLTSELHGEQQQREVRFSCSGSGPCPGQTRSNENNLDQNHQLNNRNATNSNNNSNNNNNSDLYCEQSPDKNEFQFRDSQKNNSSSRNNHSPSPSPNVSFYFNNNNSNNNNSKPNNLNGSSASAKSKTNKGCGEVEHQSILSPLPLYCPSTLSPTKSTLTGPGTGTGFPPTPPCSPFSPVTKGTGTSRSRCRLNRQTHSASISNLNSPALHKFDLETDYLDGQETEEGSSCRENLAHFQRMQRHNSLENLHHPKNHRSRSAYKKTNKKLKNRRQKSEKKDHLDCCNSDTDNNSNNTNNAALLEEKKNVLACKATTAFAMGAVRRLSLKVSKIEEKHKLKVQESAARLIMHTLLLNSWRQCRKQNEKMVKDNQMQLRTVENMCLQLRVIRQMHRDEKEKSQSRSLEVSAVSIQVSNLQRNNETFLAELEKLKQELSSSQEAVESLQSKNEDLKQVKAELQKAIALVQQEKQEEIKKIGKMEMEQIQAQDKIKDMKQQMNELSRQRSKWQEDSRGKESEIISLKSDVAFRDKHLNQIQTSYQELQRKLHQREEANQKVLVEEQKMKEQLGRSLEEIQRLSEKLAESGNSIEQQAQVHEDLKKALDKKNSDMKEMRENLGLYLRDGIERRRRWANAFHYFVFPLDIFRVLFDLPRDTLKYTVDLGEINANCLHKLPF